METNPSTVATRRRLRRAVLQTLLGTAILCAGVPASAQAWPAKPIKLVVAFSPGGPTDVIARIIARKLSDNLGQPIVIDNRPGAGGNIAAEYVAKSPADGYTLLYNSSSIVISPALFKAPKLNPVEIFQPVAYIATVPLVLVVNSSMPANSPQEFLALLKARPAKMNFGSSGNGTIDHLTSILFADRTGTQFTHVPYKGNAAAVPDLVAGRIDFMISGSINTLLPYIREGKLRAVATTTTKRVGVLPDVPTLAETIFPGFDSGTWQGIVAPAGTPAAVVARLNQEIAGVLKNPDVIAALHAQGANITGGSPEQYGELIKAEYARWTRVVKETGATPD